MERFAHLHVHTEYSLLDGQCKISRILDKAAADGMPGLAITDHGNMFGIKEFFDLSKKLNKKLKEEGKQEVKPIFGCEVYVARRGLHVKQMKVDQSGWHLILLAKNKHGYENLIKLVSVGWVDGFYMRPRVDHETIEKYHEDIICCSACIGGEVPKKILTGDMKSAEEAILWHKQLFGDDYYLELQRHKTNAANANRETYPLQEVANKALIELARKHNIKLICTNDVHFVDEENAEAHDHLICLNTGKDLDDPNRMRYTKQEWFKTTAEMNEIFSDIPEALSNTLEIVDKVEVYDIENPPIMPNFVIPEEFGTEAEYRKRLTEKDLFDEFTQDENGNVVLSEEEALKKIKKLGGYDKLYRIKLEADYLKKLTMDGAAKLYGDPLDPVVADRIKFELHVMKTMGFPGYFLIVQDFIRASREELGVSVGPGRGSAAGSAVAYCLGITKIDPIKYDLLFERFLNPDRISLPDIDTDFDDDGRLRVLEWVQQKYGVDKVAHIITYGTMATKMVLKDMARVEKLSIPESNHLAGLIPDRLPEVNGKAPKINLKNCIAAVPELQEACNSNDERVRNVMKYGQMLEGNVRGTGVHACGVIIGRDPITDVVPVSVVDDKASGGKVLVTQYDGHVIESTGLIKMDFLGLRTLSEIKEALANIKESRGEDIDIDHIPIDDKQTYQLYCEGRTVGTFQFESPGMQKYLRELQPGVFEDLIAMNALYRPGPMDYIPDFINRKLGRSPIVYDIPCMEKYLKDTYGITVYQEQVMLLSRQLANFTRGESDALRKAMGKKKKDIVDAMKPKFVAGGVANGHDAKVLEKIWGDWEKFASYAFNKSHATCYSWVAYQTAYLKAHYPAEYMAAVMSRRLSDITQITKLMEECKAMGIKTLGPDINESHLKFSVNKDGNIRFGLAAVKGVGESAVEALLQEREKNGPFKDIFDLVQRISLTACNKKNLESLALAGGFDSFKNIRREQYVTPFGPKDETFLDVLIRYGNKYQMEKVSVENSLFGGDNMIEVATPVPPEIGQWTDLQRLNAERDLVGIYLSAHPLDEYKVVLEHVCNTHMIDIDKNAGKYPDLAQKEELLLGGLVTSVRRGTSKKGNPYGIVKIEDYSGSGELPFWGEDWATYQGFMNEGNFVYIHANCQPRKFQQDSFELKVNKVELLPDVKDKLIERITINIALSQLDSLLIDELDEQLKNEEKGAEVYFKVSDDTNVLDFSSAPLKVNVGSKLLEFLEDVGIDYTINQ